MIDQTLIADLIRAGLDPELVGRVANALVTIHSGGIPVEFPVDETAAKRRAWDRNRKRKSGGIPVESGGIPPETQNSPLTKEDSKKEKKDRARATRIPPEWKPTQPDLEFALSKGMQQPRVATEAEKFRNYWTAKSGAAASKLDWAATWRNWVLSSLERAPGPPANNGGWQ